MPQFLVSEAIALNCAYDCGILHDFLEEEGIIELPDEKVPGQVPLRLKKGEKAGPLICGVNLNLGVAHLHGHGAPGRADAENGLAILPVSRGDYVISSFSAYHDFEEPVGNAA